MTDKDSITNEPAPPPGTNKEELLKDVDTKQERQGTSGGNSTEKEKELAPRTDHILNRVQIINKQVWGDQTPHKPDELAEDPSSRFRPRTGKASSHWARSLAIQAESKVDELLSDGCLCICCPDTEMRMQAIAAITAAGQFSECSTRRLFVNGETPFRIKHLFSSRDLKLIGQSQPGKRDGKNIILVIDLSDETALKELETNAERFTNPDWTDENFYFIFIIFENAINDFGLTALQEKLRVSFWGIDALSYILSGGPEPDTKCKLLLQELRSNWRIRDETNLVRKVESAHAADGLEGVQNFLQELSKRSSLDPAALWKKASLLERAALFSTVYFPKSSLPQFKLLMESLLDGQEIEIPSAEDNPQGQDGKSAPQKKPISVKALDRWRTSEDCILPSVGIEYEKSDEGAIVVSFAEPGLVHAIRKSMSPNYILAQFNRLHSAGLLMRYDVPESLVLGLVELTAEMIISHPDTYNANWVLERVAEIDHWYRDYAQTLEAGDNSPGHDETALKHFLRVVSGHMLNHFYKRLATLCRGLQRNIGTQEEAGRFLNRLIDLTQPHGFHALEVIRRLPRGDFYDPFYHLRRLCEVGSPDTCRAVTRVLLSRMEDSVQDCWVVLERVYEWLPARDVPEDKPLTGAQRWGLALLYAAYANYFIRFEAKPGFANEPLPLLLFEPGPNQPKSVRLVAEWISHPAFCSALWVLLSDEATESSLLAALADPLPGASGFEACRAEMLEGWYSLSGNKVIEQLARETANFLPKEQAVNLRVLLRQRGDSILGLIGSAIGKERQRLLDRRRNAYNLSKCCRTMTDTQPIMPPSS